MFRVNTVSTLFLHPASTRCTTSGQTHLRSGNLISIFDAQQFLDTLTSSNMGLLKFYGVKICHLFRDR